MSAPHLRYGVIRRVGGLHALVATDPHANVSGLNHAHIVCTVPDCQRDGLYMLLHHIHDLGLLQWRHSAGTLQRKRKIAISG